jgi:MerR family transcriptional regulator, light-induced transcriptional regulator
LEWSEDTVSLNVRLGDHSVTPLYNIKAVVQATGISPSTLRAWERRYKMCQPQRSESGYRLYSDRDIAVIRWLKTQVDAGMSISQAVAWLDNLSAEAGDLDQVFLPGATSTPARGERIHTIDRRLLVRDYSALQDDLLGALLAHDEAGAENIISEAFTLYTIEQVGEHLVAPVLIEIGERWHRGEVSITTEHFATSYLLQRMAAILRTLPNQTGGPVIWVGCAPGERHEVGALLLSIYLRRRGYIVHYLGQDVPAIDLAQEMHRHNPALILFSATTVASAEALGQLVSTLNGNGAAPPPIGYGGQIFSKRPDLQAGIAGVYMGASADEAVEMARHLLAGGPDTRPAGA